MTKTLRTGFLAASLLALSSGVAFADYTLEILHINDFHSRLESINKFDATCSPEDEAKKQCFGGAARLKTILDQRRAALTGQNLLVLNAGDNFQGSLFYTTYKGTAELDVVNALKFDAMTLGNHEFDDGEKALAPFLDKVQFPVVSANVEIKPGSTLGDHVKRSTVVEIGGQKIGIVGATTVDTPELASPGPNVTFTDDVAAITAEVQALKAQGVNKIVALTHVGYNRDVDVIAKIPDVDVVVGGHSHTLLSNTDPKAAGPYPTLSDNPGGYKVPVVTAASYGKYLGDIVITFDDNGVVKSAKGDPILLDSTIAPDAGMLAQVAELAKPIAEMRAKIIGKSEAPIEAAREVCRARECSMGNLVADAMLAHVKDQGIAIAIQNGGGLRASIDGGDVSQGEVITVLPFQNTLATFQLTGADIKAALENGVSQIDDGAGRFPQVAGLKYSFDKSKPAGSRVSDIQVKEGDAFVALDPAKTYGVVTNNYMRGGGDGYSVFAKNGKNAYDFGPDLADVTADYIAAHSPYKPYTDGRITDLTPVDYKPAPKPETAQAPATTAPAATAPATPAAPAPAAPAAPATPAAPAPTAPAPAAPAAPAPATPAAPAPAAPAPAAPAPAPATPAAPAASTSGPQTHVIVKGDTLWDIAEKAYGDGEKWRIIFDANGKPAPRRLLVGTELTIPAQ
ncbi:multifunctional 2',3'-cyclic-nucleotide 2'-phosphodiesterase/5'-nucleotidase/3'-nucleotidase [Rhizobium rhizosphaerae]|uniref:Multifunctional 2',3'-cyclic-nucleotide 2'-phosphodiesterase/5'-nucleotidase/3'-nucleotidase n=1 Tax=Xaviernesmea rhizosphaerae TaxID=1672749 RepID=A0ABX3PDU2_9HYPH|nr:bifunctional metallophosphatase/5'-nucleotidase [Xaviernesmea rhizosphaerae]OQP86370.1 multifunctional 2',3'-cyclic-nucleotide 2'-phosphodiesterase/5'-nucleotidase/3'-nucleotidase [Xaviernesmea rhizosphaerae]